MADPVTTLTASAIATLAFQKFIESGAGELAKKFSTEAIAKMDTLLKRVWSKLRGKPRVEEVKAVIEQSYKITPEQVNPDCGIFASSNG
jgi:methionine synthase II (cobalamin-independent)